MPGLMTWLSSTQRHPVASRDGPGPTSLGPLRVPLWASGNTRSPRNSTRSTISSPNDATNKAATSCSPVSGLGTSTRKASARRAPPLLKVTVASNCARYSSIVMFRSLARRSASGKACTDAGQQSEQLNAAAQRQIDELGRLRGGSSEALPYPPPVVDPQARSHVWFLHPTVCPRTHVLLVSASSPTCYGTRVARRAETATQRVSRSASSWPPCRR
jgi:hypothetical protein